MNESIYKERLTDAQGRVLLQLARRTLEERLKPDSGVERIDESDLSEHDLLKRKSGTFVTLKKHGDLRGCIGSLSADCTIVENVRQNALNAAFGDPRFRPLTAAELDGVDIEISVLTEPMPLSYTDGEDLKEKLRPGVDGVIIRKAGRSATFLPQVWDQLPRTEDFLRHLCMKAGLPANAWKEGPMEVSTYQVQHFDEGGETDNG